MNTRQPSLILVLASLLLSGLCSPAVTLDATYNAASDVPLSASSYTATGNTVNFTLNCAPATGTNLTVVKDTGLGFIDGTFANLAQGQAVTLTYGGVDYKFVANYYGGSGNDLVLQWAATRALAWGRNSYGQLGNSATSNSNVPVTVNTAGVLADKTVTAVAAGDSHSLALCADGTLAAWGYNLTGQLGNGNTTSASVPVAVNMAGALAGKTVVGMGAGSNYSLALCADGTLAAWGANSSGQLGNGSTTSSNVPVGVSMATLSVGERFAGATSGQSAYHSLGLVAQPFAPRIAVEWPAGIGLTDGVGSVDIGQVASGGSLLQTFTIRNTGNTDISSLSIAEDGENADEFAVGMLGATSLVPNATTTFTVTFFPNGISARIATIHIISNVTGAANPFDVDLTGTGLTQIEQWRLTHFQTTDNIGNAADLATPQNDGVVNLMKFATGMNPGQTGTMPGTSSRSGAELVFTYLRSKAAVIDGITFTVEWSDALTSGSWSHANVTETAADHGDTQLVTATLPAGAGPQRFLRLKVTGR